MSDLGAEHREMLKNEIKKKVKLDVKNQVSLEKIPLERLVERYIEMSVEVIKEMEKRRDPVFLEVLQYAQAHLTREEFLSIQIEVYAACNKIAMEQCTPVDKIAHLVVLHEAFL
ncbi:hypothetical protein PYW08_000644 [Mythimna loreyi]|uniref:Uncharacterized protein n=1 Tax=Mythimna loreyi TaxID=667449 RepID=A0ACC2RD36_9NEOP|nr:hypothetical protein PYW08_000644 [Mythimna loreyi]